MEITASSLNSTPGPSTPGPSTPGPSTPEPSTPEPSLADVLQKPALLESVNVGKALAALSNNISPETVSLVEKAMILILSHSSDVRTERFFAACLDWAVWPTKLEERSAHDLAKHSFGEQRTGEQIGEQTTAHQRLQSQFHEFQFSLMMILPGDKIIKELPCSNHAICYDFGRLLAGISAREPKTWEKIRVWIEKAEAASFVDLESKGGDPAVTLSLAAMQPLFRGFTKELPLQLKSHRSSARPFVKGLTNLTRLANRVSADSGRTNPIYGDAKQALAAIAALDPSLFDREMSRVLNLPQPTQLIAKADTAQRRMTHIQTRIETKFGLSIGAFQWEEMPRSRGPVKDAVYELYRELKSDFRGILTERTESSEGAFSMKPLSTLGLPSEMLKRDDLMNRIHGFRAIGVPILDLIKELLPCLKNENSLLSSKEYRNAVVLIDNEAAQAQVDALTLGETHIIDREFILPLLSTILERCEKVSDSALLTELEKYARLGGEFSESALKLLHLSTPDTARSINAEALNNAVSFPEPHTLPDLLDRCVQLKRIIEVVSPTQLLQLLDASLPIAERLDIRFIRSDRSNFRIVVDPALQRPELWAEWLRLDEKAALQNLLRVGLVGSILVGDNDQLDDEAERTVSAKRMLTQEIALQTVIHVAKLLPETELRILFREVWRRLDEQHRLHLISSLTDSELKMISQPTLASTVILSELGAAAAAVTAAISQRLARLRNIHANWSVNQYYCFASEGNGIQSI